MEMKTKTNKHQSPTVANVTDNRQVTERIATLSDACRELGDDHSFVQELRLLVIACPDALDVVSFLQLRIIAAALNEGWSPQFSREENRHYPHFLFYAKEEIPFLNDSERAHIEEKASSGVLETGGILCCGACRYSGSGAPIPSPLAFKTEELAVYAGRQFVNIWARLIR